MQLKYMKTKETSIIDGTVSGFPSILFAFFFSTFEKEELVLAQTSTNKMPRKTFSARSVSRPFGCRTSFEFVQASSLGSVRPLLALGIWQFVAEPKGSEGHC